MALSDVLNALVFNGYTAAEERTIRDVFIRIYNDSPTARAALEDWVTGVSLIGHEGVLLPENSVRVRGNPTEFRQLDPGESRPIIFTQQDGAARAAWFTGQLDYDLDYIEGRSYIDNFGNAVGYQHLVVIVHELGHAIAGLRDNVDYDRISGSVTGDVAGDTVRFQNVIQQELGIPARNSYLAQSTDLVEGFAYTDGQQIDRSITSNGNVFVPQSDGLRYLLINTGEGGRQLRGGNNADWLYGMGGNDLLVGWEGHDFLDGGTGDDRLNGGNGSDTLIGGQGDDWLQGLFRNDRLEGNEGNDSLLGGTGDDTLFGGEGGDRMFAGTGDDTIDAGAGNDWLIFGDADGWNDRGSGGRDIFVFNRGNGVDQIHDFEDGLDQIRLGAGLSFSDVQLSRNGNATDVTFSAGAAMGDRIKLIGIEPDQITFSDFEGVTGPAVPLQPTYTGTAGADNFSDRVGGDDVIFTGGGNDTIFASGGDDIIDAGPGTDWNVFGDWANWTTPAAGGRDSFWLKTGNGIDQIRDFEDGIDRILLEDGKTFDDVVISQWSNITEIRYEGGLSGDRMMLVGINRAQITAQDFVTLADIGQSPTQPAPTPDYRLRYGTEASEEISAGAGSQKILARGGNDTIYAGPGDDWINAGAGNDWNVFGNASSWDERGEGGADIFFFAEGNQIDQIHDFEDGIDKIELANGRGFENVELSGWASNTMLRFVGGDSADMMILLGVLTSQINEADFI